MDPKPVPEDAKKTGGEVQPEPPAPQPVKSGGMSGEGGAPAAGPDEDDREGGMIGEG